MGKGVFVTGIGTDVGKTVIAAILLKRLNGTYWKPMQCGDPADTKTVAELTGMGKEHFHPESFYFSLPASPHKAADVEGVHVSLTDLQLPFGDNWVVEGAGGLMVPINGSDTYLDLMVQLGLPVVVVSRHYLGSINHTLMTLTALRSANVEVAGIVWNGNEDHYTESAILKRFPHPVIGRVLEHETITPALVESYSKKFWK